MPVRVITRQLKTIRITILSMALFSLFPSGLREILEDGGKDKDHQEEEAKYTMSERSTVESTKRRSISEGL
jgi:hypothetical protein